jgi:hypothetical protein
MLDEYDFSGAERGKFYIPQEEIRLAHYIPLSLEQKLALLTLSSGRSRDDPPSILASCSALNQPGSPSRLRVLATNCVEAVGF